MVDVLTAEQRRFNMSRIRGRDTRPELLLRRGLHARGLRYRLHRRDLPGRPDLVFPRFCAVVFVHGCFWHGHRCRLFSLPATRPDFWAAKIQRTGARDCHSMDALMKCRWRVLTVWECAMRGRDRLDFESVLCAVEAFLASTATQAEISGVP
jgi:DNA mismatch endonuclease (patch repair protein)